MARTNKANCDIDTRIAFRIAPKPLNRTSDAIVQLEASFANRPDRVKMIRVKFCTIALVDIRGTGKIMRFYDDHLGHTRYDIWDYGHEDASQGDPVSVFKWQFPRQGIQYITK